MNTLHSFTSLSARVACPAQPHEPRTRAETPLKHVLMLVGWLLLACDMGHFRCGLSLKKKLPPAEPGLVTDGNVEMPLFGYFVQLLHAGSSVIQSFATLRQLHAV